VSRGYAYVSRDQDLGEDSSGLLVIDVSNPSHPIEAGLAQWRGSWGVTVSGGYVYSTNYWGGGMKIYADCAGGPIVEGFESFIPAAAVAAGAEGAFFQTDVEVNNNGPGDADIYLQWLPRGENNSEAADSDLYSLGPGHSVRFENVLTGLFGLGPDALGALKLVSSSDSLIAMSRTYNIPSGGATGTFGQGLPAVRASDMMTGTDPHRIICLTENSQFRSNVGCVNGTDQYLRIYAGVFDNDGSALETRTLDLAPYSNGQLNRVLGGWAPVNGYVDVWADHENARYYCYGSMLDNETSDPTTILPLVPSDDTTFIPAAALAAGAEGSFFTTDLDLNNAGSSSLNYELLWLPRGEDNGDPVHSDTFSLAAGSGVRYGNVLGEVFGLSPDEVGALSIEASEPELLAMSRTYNTPSASGSGTFGQELAGIAADRMIPTGVTRRILFLSEDDDIRSNVGCINGVGSEVTVTIDLYNSDGVKLETRYLIVPAYSNRQINGIFGGHAPIDGYVDVRTHTPEALIYCYGSVLDNVTSDPTTVLPQ
jgi:hypothetical protein